MPVPLASNSETVMYYVCKQSEDHTAVRGPFRFPWPAADEVMKMQTPTDYCTFSRWELAKLKIYPRNKAGDAKLLRDLEANVATV